MRRPEFQRKDAETRRRKKAKKENEDFYFLVLLLRIFAPLRLRAFALNSALFSDSLLVRTALASLSLSTAPLRRGSRRALPRQICDLERGGSKAARAFARRPTSTIPRTVSRDSMVSRDSACSKGSRLAARMSYLLAAATRFVAPSLAGGARRASEEGRFMSDIKSIFGEG